MYSHTRSHTRYLPCHDYTNDLPRNRNSRAMIVGGECSKEGGEYGGRQSESDDGPSSRFAELIDVDILSNSQRFFLFYTSTFRPTPIQPRSHCPMSIVSIHRLRTPFLSLSKSSLLRPAPRITCQSPRPLSTSIRNMSDNSAYKLNESGGVDYKESKGGDQVRPQLPPDVGGQDGGKSPRQRGSFSRS